MSVIRACIKDGYVKKKGEAPVYISFYIAREKIEIPCKLSVSLKAWDKDVGKVTTRDKFHADRNMMIDNIKKRVNDIFVRYRLANKNLTREVFLNEYYNPTDFKTFFEYVEWFQRLRFKEIEDYLTEPELTKLTELYSSKKLPDNLQKVLGFFLFMCFTSLHISDAKAVKMEQISNTTLTYYRKKNRNSKPEPILYLSQNRRKRLSNKKRVCE